jgi:hypothetical protein
MGKLQQEVIFRRLSRSIGRARAGSKPERAGGLLAGRKVSMEKDREARVMASLLHAVV